MSIRIRTGLKPGDLGYITYLHGKIYSEEYGFNTSFEPYVARPLSDFSLSDDPRQNIWIVEKEGAIVGCVAIVDAGDDLAQLRWLILTENARGLGLGRKLVELALDFCRKEGYHGVFLWTVDLLVSAAAIYKAYGFRVTEEKRHIQWDRLLNEQRYDLLL